MLMPTGRKISERLDPATQKRIFNILQITFESGVA